jgi:hypothetical protein
MLLGVDDFESEQAYHRGKLRLHNAWLHGEGVVWGLGVDLPAVEGNPGTLRGEIRVAPGFALDAAGRELHLDTAACVNVAPWYAAHRDDPEVRDAATVGEDGTVTLDAHVTACFRACLARPVPALSEPCDGAGTDTAYSRAHETVELRLVPGPPPPRVDEYPRLRLLFGLREAEVADSLPMPRDKVVLDAVAAILGLGAAEQPAAYLEAFRRFAALDEMDRAPAQAGESGSGFFPAGDDTCVVLASVAALTLSPTGADGALVFTGATVDNTVRRAHVATSTLQDLLCGPLFRASGGGAPQLLAPINEAPSEGGGSGRGDLPEEDFPAEAGDANAPADPGIGPRIDPGSVRLEGEVVTMRSVGRLSRASVAPESFSVSSYDLNDGWASVEVRAASVDRGGTRVRLDLTHTYTGNLVRVIARGTGPAPLLGTNLAPLNGAAGGPGGGDVHDGRDFVLMLRRSEK